MVDKVISASLVVDLRGNTEKGSMSAEIDSRPDGSNLGITTFVAGDNPGILLFRSDNVVNVQAMASEGSVSTKSSGDMTTEEWVVFANTNSANTSKPISGGFTVVEARGDSLPDLKYAGSQITCSKKVLAVIKVRYSTTFRLYRLSGVSGDAPVVVLFSGEVFDG